MSMKEKMILRTAKRLGYDVNNPKSITQKTITDTITVSMSFMTKQELIEMLKAEIRRLEGE